jgi:hypothetical protein
VGSGVNQYEKAHTAAEFTKRLGGEWGFDGLDMVIGLKTKKAVSAAKREIPDGLIRKETLGGKTGMVCRF